MIGHGDGRHGGARPMMSRRLRARIMRPVAVSALTALRATLLV